MRKFISAIRLHSAATDPVSLEIFAVLPLNKDALNWNVRVMCVELASIYIYILVCMGHFKLFKWLVEYLITMGSYIYSFHSLFC